MCPCHVGHKWPTNEGALEKFFNFTLNWGELELPYLEETACLLFTDRCTARPMTVTSNRILPEISRSLLRHHSASLLWPASCCQWGWAPVGAACDCIMLWKWNEGEEWVGIEDAGLINGSAAIFFSLYSCLDLDEFLIVAPFFQLTFFFCLCRIQLVLGKWAIYILVTHVPPLRLVFQSTLSEYFVDGQVKASSVIAL